MKCGNRSLYKSHYSATYKELSWNYMKLHPWLLYIIDINKSVHINLLCKTFYINVIFLRLLFTEVSKVRSNFTHHTLRIKRHSSQHPCRDANKQTEKSQFQIETLNPMLIFLKNINIAEISSSLLSEKPTYKIKSNIGTWHIQ